jgi:DNA-binding response OmpR family regulator
MAVVNKATKILVIDDDVVLRGILRTALEYHGFLASGASNGREAITLIQNEIPDVVLTDVVMPDQDGLETIGVLRKRFPEVKIIAMSGGGPMDVNDLLNVARKLGADGCLPKPFANESLLAEIERVLAS